MTTLSVLEFNSVDGADKALQILQRLQQQQLIKLVDAAVVTWPQGSKGPKTRQMVSTARAGAIGGAFWGFLIGLIFLVPLLGLAIGAAGGAIGGALADFGITTTSSSRYATRLSRGRRLSSSCRRMPSWIGWSLNSRA